VVDLKLEEASPDLLRAMVQEFAEALMGAEADAGPSPAVPMGPHRRRGATLTRFCTPGTTSWPITGCLKCPCARRPPARRRSQSSARSQAAFAPFARFCGAFVPLRGPAVTAGSCRRGSCA
jgi:hypothetical protein